jgi:hypothetical protein
MSERVTLSASRIKTAQSCSWLYWFKYHLKAPDKSNDGAKRGTICHNVFELLGDPKHKKDFDKISSKQDVFASAKVKKLILQQAKESCVDDETNLNLIKEMTLNGLNYDFFGHDHGKKTAEFSERDFEFDVQEKDFNFKIKGFIDKLFIYGKKAIIRDFKSSKEVFKGKEIEDNLQDLMYTLAVKKLYPELKNISSEFIFLKFHPDKGVIKMPPVSDLELDGFQEQLTLIQKYLTNFNERTAKSRLAAKADYPKDNSFGGPLMCGFAKTADELKKDGTPKWSCAAKHPFKFFHIKENDKIIDSCFLDQEKDYRKKYPDKIFELIEYAGCPAFYK